MSNEECERRVDEVREMARDYEVAHAREDALFVDVLKAVRAGAPNSAELAKIALGTLRFKFARHCS